MTSIGWGDWDRTSACGFQRPVPYRLATPQGKRKYTQLGKPRKSEISSACAYSWFPILFIPPFF